MLFLFVVVAATGFADSLILNNETSYPTKDRKTKISVQWAKTAKEVDDGNKAIMYGTPLYPESIQTVTQTGKNTLHIPKDAEYFRILVWSKGEGEPDMVTNWVDVVPNKNYCVKGDHLVPAVLMSGTGC